MGRDMKQYTAFFYKDDGLVALTDPVWLQGAFETMTGLLYRVVIQTNSMKTVSMICRQFWAAGNQSEAT